jgi:hypothetical protein
VLVLVVAPKPCECALGDIVQTAIGPTWVTRNAGRVRSAERYRAAAAAIDSPPSLRPFPPDESVLLFRPERVEVPGGPLVEVNEIRASCQHRHWFITVDEAIDAVRSRRKYLIAHPAPNSIR